MAGLSSLRWAATSPHVGVQVRTSSWADRSCELGVKLVLSDHTDNAQALAAAPGLT